MLPPWPGWDGLHPLVIHFPIALLIVAPVFLLLALLVPRHFTGFAVSALVLLVLGTVAAFVAVSTGEAAAELADRTDVITAAIMAHSELAERTRDIFAAITALYAVLLLLPVFVKRLGGLTFRRVAGVLILLLALAGGLQLAAAAHQGGMLVHQLGVRAFVATAPAAN